MALVVDASVGLKWILEEPDSHLARALAVSDEVLFVPDFWLNEACNASMTASPLAAAVPSSRKGVSSGAAIDTLTRTRP